jgi:hypothetical protein
MKKKILKPFLIASVSLMAAFGYYTYTKACADVGWEDWYQSMFAPEMVSEKGKEPFFRSMMQFYKSPYYYDNISLFDNVNVNEWHAFFKSQVTKADIRTLLYQTTTGQIDTAIFHLRDSAYPITANLISSSIFTYPTTVDAKDFLFYVGYARRCEPYATYNPNSWYYNNDETWRNDVAAMDKLVEGGQKMIGIVKNPFIKERYIFQVLRLKFLQNDYNGVIDYYNQNKQHITTGNTMRYRCLGYLAGAHRKMGQLAQANLMYAQIFDQCQPMRVVAFQSFSPNNETDWQEMLALATSKNDKCAIWQLLGLKHDALRAAKEIYAIDPYSDKTELLLSRMVNQAEETFLPTLGYSHNYYRPDTVPANYALASPKNVDPETPKFVTQVALSGKASNPLLWKLSAGYLSLAQGNYNDANNMLTQVMNHASVTPLMKKQARMLLLTSHIDQTVKLTGEFETQMARELTWLNDQRTDTILRASYAYNWCLQRLGYKYYAQGQIIKAQLLHNLTDYYFYLSDDNCKKMKDFFDRSNKSDFEKFLAKQYPYTKSDIVEIEALKLFYVNKLDLSNDKLAEDATWGTSELLGDPFKIRINDCHDCDHLEEQKVTYTQRSFIEKMDYYRLRAISHPKEAANCYFMLANGFYNATYFGNARMFYATPLIDFGSYAYWYRDFSGINPLVLDCQTALSYYLKAMDASTDKEFKAKCCFMAAKCEQNALFISGQLGSDEDFRAGKYFAMLKSDYRKTDYYKEVIEECKYFNAYARK